MNADQLTQLIVQLVSIPSVTENELAVLLEVEEVLTRRGLSIERIPVAENRWNIFVAAGTPRLIFSTHLDVVPAPAWMFTPRIEDGKIFGRGTCDAKGIAACMIAAFFRLLDAGKKDMGLLFVVGEEMGGLGAEIAVHALKGRGVKYLINGEPTESQLAAGHKGFLLFNLTVPGKSCHSGYPELGIDANRTLIEICNQIYAMDFGYSDIFGPSSVNIGVLNAGVAPNVISPQAKLSGVIRTVNNANEQLQKLKSLLPPDATLEILQCADPIELKMVDGFGRYVAAYGTDVLHLKNIGAECLMYGPGSILVAHTDDEYLAIHDAMKAVDVYCQLCELLQ